MNTKEILETLFGDSLILGLSEHKSIVACDSCTATGYTRREELTNYHRGEYTTYTDTCEKCAGEGRLTKTTVEIGINKRYPHMGRWTHTIDTFLPFSQDPIDAPIKYVAGDSRSFPLNNGD
ncbi:hypothetical protein PHIN3_184 [Sinorhizobium phage phiN3]|uniref:Uncharacterized protein n=2 Tax=Emdodecavirus TaxID=1980937 RepID=A0A0F6YP73_9CAUD|nr:hypothetical protein AVT40_gp349 [Sinorhizobium phage phiN3]AKF13447.1 hypothetical protein PHIN3_184 [Sinorhizobium phage phiN3]